jgi:hypothetical protein
MRTQQQISASDINETMTSTAKATTSTASANGRTALFEKCTRKNQEFERFLCNGQEAAVLDATTSKYIPLTYFVTPHPHNTPHNTSSEASAVGGRTPRNAHGLADKMPYESFRLINLQQRGNHAHSLVLFKSRAITTNPENIAIFECNGQLTQTEIRVIHTYHPKADTDDEPGTVYDVTEDYLAMVSPRVCMNYGNHKYNPGYCGIFGIIAMTFFREWGSEPTKWVKKWNQLLKYMRQELIDEPESHGCMGTDLAAKVQEIIAAHPSTATGHKNAEKEIMKLLKEALRAMKQKE